jgi:hypothetical protein
MTGLAHRTVLPAEHSEGLSGVRALLGPQPGGHAMLTGTGGTRLELPGEIFGVLREVVAALAQLLAIILAPYQAVLSMVVPSARRLTEAYQSWVSSAGPIVTKVSVAWPRPTIRSSSWASVGSSI